jgi:cytochrome c oxidase assembly factor CtaG
VLVLVAWHIPACYDYALAHSWAHRLEHALFLGVGLLVWSQLIDPARRGRLSAAQRGLYAVAMLAIGHVLLHPVFFSSGPLYDVYSDQPRRLLGLSPLADQYLAAWTMTVDQVATLGVLAFVLLIPRRETGYAPA